MFFDDDPTDDGRDALPFFLVAFPMVLAGIGGGILAGPPGAILAGMVAVFILSQLHRSILRWLGRLPNHPPAVRNAEGLDSTARRARVEDLLKAENDTLPLLGSQVPGQADDLGHVGDQH
jgi:hypothetical protein